MTEAAPTPRSRRWLKPALQFGGLAICLAILANRLDFSLIGQSLARVPAGIALLALLCWNVGMGARVWKWAVQAKALGFEFEWFTLARQHLWGMLVGIATPMRVGEAYRLTGLKLGGASDAGTGAAAIFYEKIVEAQVLGCIVAIGAYGYFGNAALAAFLLAGAGVGGVLIYGSISFPAVLLTRVRPLAMLQRSRDALSPGQRVAIFSLTSLAHGANFLGGGLIYRALGEISWGTLCFGLPSITFAAAAPFTISGVGVRELAAIEVFGRTGMAPEELAAAASTSFVGANVLPVVCLVPATWAAAAFLGRRHSTK
jgi:hypothetical protein